VAATPNMAKLLCVYCSSSRHLEDKYYKAAEAVGRAMVGNGWGLVYGGGNVGMMGSLAAAVKGAGGHVVGVIPEFMKERELAYTQSDELITVHTMRERKRVMEERASAFLALPGGISPRASNQIAILDLGRFELGPRVLEFLELKADRFLPLRQLQVHERHDVLADHEKDDQEDDQLGDERPVGDQEVVRLRARRRRRWADGCDKDVHACSDYLPSTKTNMAMKARLMKYIASTRPTVRKKIGISRGCDSG